MTNILPGRVFMIKNLPKIKKNPEKIILDQIYRTSKFHVHFAVHTPVTQFAFNMINSNLAFMPHGFSIVAKSHGSTVRLTDFFKIPKFLTDKEKLKVSHGFPIFYQEN